MKETLVLMAMALLTIFSLGCATSKKTSSSQPAGYDARLSGFDYPFPVAYHEVQSQGQKLQMAYMDVAPKSPSAVPVRTLVLLHGKNFSGFYFASLIEVLRAKGYRLVIPDQIGFGKSSKPESYQFSFQELAANTHSLLQHLAVGEYELLGHSMGGMLATRMALMNPKEVRRLILINPIGLEDWKTMASYRTVDELYKVELAQTLEKAREYQKQNYYDGEWSEQYEALLQVLEGWLRGPDYAKVAWNSALTANMIFTQPVVYEFKNLKMPVVLINGLRDRTAIGRDSASPEIQKQMGDYPKLGRAALKQFSRGRLIELRGLGHVPFIENPEKFWLETATVW